MKLLDEFRKTLKDPIVEERLDLLLFRPLAFIVLQLVRRLPVTPNQLSAFSMLFGIGSGILFSRGTRDGFLAAGVLYGLTRVIDCSDGMLARIKNAGTLTGRIIDGIIDYINASAVMIGMLAGLIKGGFELPASPWLLVGPAAFFMILHSILIDYFRMGFLSHGLGKSNSPRADFEKFSAELARLKQQKPRSLDRWIIWVYLGYLKTQLARARTAIPYDREAYFRANRRLLPAWSLVGSSSYIFVIMVSAILGRPAIFFVYALGFANLCCIVLLIIQMRTNRAVMRAAPDPRYGLREVDGPNP